MYRSNFLVGRLKVGASCIILLWIFCFVHHLFDFICQKYCYCTWHLSSYMKT